MKLLSPSDNFLYKKVEPFDFKNPPIDPFVLSKQMLNFMREREAVGLAANQVGLPYRMFVMEAGTPFAIFNPKIVAISDDLVSLNEGCLTFPDLWLEVKRPEWVRARFTTPSGKTITEMFGGYHARVFLHEYDHLEGKVFTWKVTPRELEKARKKAKLYQRAKELKNEAVKQF